MAPPADPYADPYRDARLERRAGRRRPARDDAEPMRLVWVLLSIPAIIVALYMLLVYGHLAAAPGHVGTLGLAGGLVWCVVRPPRTFSLMMLWIGLFLLGVAITGFRNLEPLPTRRREALQRRERRRIEESVRRRTAELEIDAMLCAAGHRESALRTVERLRARRFGYAHRLPELCRWLQIEGDAALAVQPSLGRGDELLGLTNWGARMRALDRAADREDEAAAEAERLADAVIARLAERGFVLGEHDPSPPPAATGAWWDPLEKALVDDDPAVRRRTAELLLKLSPALKRDRTHLRCLVQAFVAARDPSHRRFLLDAMTAAFLEADGRRVRRHAVVIVGALGDDDPLTRARAAAALGRIASADARVITALDEVVRPADPRYRHRRRAELTRLAYGWTTWPPDSEELRHIELPARVCSELAAEADSVEKLAERLEDGKALVRLAAVALLGERASGDPDAVRRLAHALTDSCWLVRLVALRALGGGAPLPAEVVERVGALRDDPLAPVAQLAAAVFERPR